VHGEIAGTVEVEQTPDGRERLDGRSQPGASWIGGSRAGSAARANRLALVSRRRVPGK